MTNPKPKTPTGRTHPDLLTLNILMTQVDAGHQKSVQAMDGLRVCAINLEEHIADLKAQRDALLEAAKLEINAITAVERQEAYAALCAAIDLAEKETG